jgi:hypothetical protein
VLTTSFIIVLLAAPVVIVGGFLWLVWQGVLFIVDLLRYLARGSDRPIRYGHDRYGPAEDEAMHEVPHAQATRRL